MSANNNTSRPLWQAIRRLTMPQILKWGAPIGILGMILVLVGLTSQRDEARREEMRRTWQFTSAEIILPDGRKAPMETTSECIDALLTGGGNQTRFENQLVYSSMDRYSGVKRIITWSRRKQ